MTRGRHRATASPGRLTVAEVAKLSGLSARTVLRRIAGDRIVAQREPDGSLSISEEDVHALQPRPPGVDKRVAVMVRVPAEEHAAWVRKADGQPVSTWLRGLARRAAGLRGAIGGRRGAAR